MALQHYGMDHGLRSLVGRAGELGELRAGLEATAAGHGGVWLIAGEPGIGKSRLAEEIAREAGDRAIRVHWGRCWEAGGAPAYWPWIQVLRELVRELDPARVAAPLAQLLPELRGDQPPAAPGLSPERARFALLDAATTTLVAAAELAPRLIILDDLHSADSSTILLLDFLSHAVRGAPLVVIGTFRDAEAHAGEAGALLHQVARRAHTLALAPLDRGEVGELLGRALGDLDGELVDAVFTRSEGNPLFAVELARVLANTGGRPFDERGGLIPPTLRTAIREHVAAVPDETAELLAMAAIWGREIDLARLAAMSDRRPEAIAEALEAAARAHLVIATGAGGFRFAHILTREVALAELDGDRRSQLHLRAAEILEQAGAPWSEIAHHCLAAGEPGRAGAIDAAICAGREAIARLAFGDGVAWLRTALETLETGAEVDDARRAALLTELGGALFGAGDDQAGRRACTDAADCARAVDRPDLLASAALELGSVLRFGRVDRRLVTLLEESAEALGERPSPMRARVLARLAAALQPAEDPSVPMALARSAIDMARELGDDDALLATLRTGSSAFVDLVSPAARIEDNREHLALARRLGAGADVYQAATRLALNCFELGDLAGAEAAIDEVARIAGELDHPSYRWRVDAFAATRALWQGRFADAERSIAAASALAAEAGDANAGVTALHQRLRLYRLTGRDDELTALLPALRGMYRGTPTAEPLAQILAAAAALLVGRTDGLSDMVVGPLQLADQTSLGNLAAIARATGDRRLATAVIDRLAGADSDFLSSGVIGMTWDEPVHHALANAHLARGEVDAAVEHLEAGIEAARALGGAPVVGWLAEELARLIVDELAEPRRARPLVDEARAIASELGMVGLAARADALAARLGDDRPVAATAGLSLERDGDVWRVSRGDRAVRLKSTKGLVFLSRLVQQPGREIHVLDLVSDGEGEAPIDLGDAGEHLDATARDAYRRRAAELRDELAGAEEANDLGRAERARHELEFLTAELSRAVGLGGGERRAGQAAERARVNVQRRIRDAVRRIAEHDGQLARHIERSVRTGRFCCYEPT